MKLLKLYSIIIINFLLFNFISSIKQSKTIYFIRHGETNFNVGKVHRVCGKSQIELSEIGHIHANKLGQYLSNEKISKIYFSPLRRAKETADEIKEYQQYAKMEEEPLINNVDWGDWDGKPINEIFGSESYKLMEKHPILYTIPNGESVFHLADRMRQFLIKIYNSDDDNVIAVTHKENLLILGCLLFDLPLTKATKFEVNCCGIVKVIMNDIDDIKLIHWNSKSFLE